MPRPITLALACLLVGATPALADAPVWLAYGGPAAEQDFQKYKQNVETSLQEAEAAYAAGQVEQGSRKAQEALRRFQQYNGNPAVTGNDFWKAYVADGSVEKRVTDLAGRATLIDGAMALKRSYNAMRENYKKHEAALKANKPAEAIGQLGFLEHEGKGALRRYEALKAKGVDLTRVTYVVDNQDISGVALLADLERMMAVAANRANLHQQAQAKWKAVLKADRLKVYLEHGQPEWKDDVNGFDPASAAKAAKWSYSRGPYHSLQLGRYRIYKEFHFSGDKLVKQTTENKPY